MIHTSPKLPISAGFTLYVKLVNPPNNPIKFLLSIPATFARAMTYDKHAMASDFFSTASARNRIQSQDYKTPSLLNRMTSFTRRTTSPFSRMPSLLSRIPSREYRTTSLLNRMTSHKHRTSNHLRIILYCFDNRQIVPKQLSVIKQIINYQQSKKTKNHDKRTD